MRTVFIVGMGLLVCCACAHATDVQTTSTPVVHNTAAAFVAQFKKAVRNWNLDFIGEHLAYPVPVYILGVHKSKLYGSTIAVSKQGYLNWMTPYLYKLIENAPSQKLVKLFDIKKGPSGEYLIHNLQYTADPDDHAYSKYSIASDKTLRHILHVLRKGAKTHCASCVAKVIAFPINACINGAWKRFKNRQEFVRNYDNIVTPHVKRLMIHAWENGNWKGFPMKGIMLGDIGDIWIQSFARKNAIGLYVWVTKVTALHKVGGPYCRSDKAYR